MANPGLLQLKSDLCLEDIRDIFAWGTAHLAVHVEGAFPRNRDEPRAAGAAGDAALARWRTRCVESIINTSFARKPRKKTLFRQMCNLPMIPAVPAGRLEGTAAFLPTPPDRAEMGHIILAAMEYIIEDTDRQKARDDLNAANIRQGCMRAEEFFKHHFDPAVHIARLEDTQYADKLLKGLNDGIHKKM